MTLSFSELALVEPIQRALHAENYEHPTPIQAQAIPHLLAGRDLLGIAQTGTGKTAAFALPILQHLAANRVPAPRNSMRALVLTPTRELAMQIADSFRAYGRHLGLRTAVIFGGVGQGPQVDALRRGIDILVATPGRLLDLHQQGHVRYDGVSVFVLDEADRMLDMGFIRDIRRIVPLLPKARQSLLFSATMPDEINRLIGTLLKDPVRVEVTPAATTVERIEQRVMFVDAGNKRALLASLLGDKAIARALVFTRTKHGANRVAEGLAKGGIGAEAIHGNKSQSQRQRALGNFRDGRTRVLVATDIAARGIDIDGITHVINFELPNVPESYVHRIGRTARAGADGVAISFCDHSEKGFLRDIEKVTRQKIAVAEHAFRAPAGQAANGDGGRPHGHNGHGHNGGHNGHAHGNGGHHGNGNGRGGEFANRRRRSRRRGGHGHGHSHGPAPTHAG
ncbi:MAG TPA: DEAD/DEAH box helicase [Stellaceae bacterium]|nr:DEAD/DEAH box helicase [Stellaceae bacterium]HEV2263336.1 DEAD/DEAH box helicase [Stellaceae bacterium]